MRYRSLSMVLAAILASTASGAGRTYWYEIDTAQSQITFLAKSRIAKAQGIFRKWDFRGKINANLHVVGDLHIDCASIDTDNDRRDNHLRGADFFNCEQFPQHTFRILSAKGDAKQPVKSSQFEVSGQLTMHGKTVPVTLTMGREGNEARMTLTGTVFIDREAFGISYNSALNPIEKLVRVDIRLVLQRKGDRQ